MSYARVDGKDTIIFVDPESSSEAAATTPSVEEKAEDSTNAEAQSGEQDQSAAFDPETGEINWDCPCKCIQYPLMKGR
jgi:hypothetical protein